MKPIHIKMYDGSGKRDFESTRHRGSGVFESGGRKETKTSKKEKKVDEKEKRWIRSKKEKKLDRRKLDKKKGKNGALVEKVMLLGGRPLGRGVGE